MAKAKGLKKSKAPAHAELQSVVIDNPFFQRGYTESPSNPTKIRAAVNIRESGIEYLYARKFIDEAQKRAADKFRGLWEAMGGSGAGAIDYSREKVDGGRTPDPISAAQVNAGRELALVKQHLGDYGYRLIGYIAGEGYTPKELCTTAWQRKVMSAMMRTFLDQLAEFWKFKSRDRSYQVVRVGMPDQARKAGIPEFVVQPSSATAEDVMASIKSVRKDWQEFSVSIVGPNRNMPVQEANDLALKLAEQHRTTAMPFSRAKVIEDELLLWG